jgi:O-methyltransferase
MSLWEPQEKNLKACLISLLETLGKIPLRKILSYFNLTIVRLDRQNAILKLIKNEDPHLEDEFKNIIRKLENIYGDIRFEPAYIVYSLTKYISDKNIDGDLVECGVLEGKMVAVMIETLSLRNDFKRNIFLYDTFEGMTEPSAKDYQSVTGQKMKKGDNYCSLEDVKDKIFKLGYKKDKIFFKKGDVKDTLIRNNMPENISLLRLDTDFYESSLIELERMYDLVSANGFIIYDDYGHWHGQYEATNEFFKKRNLTPLLIRTSRQERIQIKKLGGYPG